ncbi:MAG TPA: hypothetical protein VMM76_01100 [Pirellulaceae bacterium]|nr:hypothetical protein [Pirellulaceae bacterium]
MRLQVLAMALAALNAGSPLLAGDEGHDGKHAGHARGGQRAFCPHCGDACYPTVTKGTETKHCWNVETKAICIPKVRFPWEKSCCDKGCGKDGCVPPKCGRTKYVDILLKHEYECSTCKYSWDVDSYKHDSGQSAKKSLRGYSADDQPVAAEPPTVEVSLPHSNRRSAPAGFEQSDRR